MNKTISLHNGIRESGQYMRIEDDSVYINKVVNIELIAANPRTVLIKEDCDQYFYAYLNKGQFGEFIEALKAIYDKMLT